MKQAIRTDEDARAYLAEHHADTLEAYLVDTDKGPRIRIPDPCGRCGGSGNGGWFQDGGVCYECCGADTRNRTRSWGLKAYGQLVKRKDTARARKVEARRRENEARAAAGATFLAERSELAAALQVDSPLLADLADRLARWGSLSDAQVALALRVAGELTARAAAPKANAPTGRHTVEGTVLGLKWRDSAYGGAWKVTLEIVTPEGSWRAWGSLPAAIEDQGPELVTAATAAARAEDPYTAETFDLPRVLRGRRLRFAAAFEVSDEADFAFFKRPTKAELLPLVVA